MQERTRQAKLLGHRIRNALKWAGVTQRDAAKHLGVTPQTLINWNKGIYVPDALQLAEVARLCGVTPNSLLLSKPDLGKLRKRLHEVIDRMVQ